ncbi:MAG: tetratricopeptide repeat protein [Chitinophagales bacterium]
MATIATQTQAQAPTASDGEKRLNRLLELAEWHASIQPQKAILQAEEALEIATLKADKSAECKLMYILGTTYLHQGRLEIAMEYFNQALDLCRKCFDTTTLVKTYNAIGDSYKLKDNNKLALEYYFKALKYDVKSFNTTLYNNIAHAYAILKKYDKAVEYLQKGMSLAQSQNETEPLISCLINIGSNYYLQGKYKKAIEHFNQALETAMQYRNFTKQSVKCLHDIGSAHEYLGNYEMALENYRKALEISRNCSYFLDSCMNLYRIGNIRLKQKLYDKSLKYFYKCLEMIDEYSFESQRIDCLKGIYETYEMLEDYANANRFLKAVIEVQDKQYNQKMEQEMAALLLDKEEEVALLEEKRKKVELQNQSLSSSYKVLEYNNKELQQYAYVVAHDLKEPLRNIGSFAALLQKRYGDSLDATAIEFMQYILKNTTHMNELLSDLLKYATVNKDVQGLVIEEVKTQSVVEEVQRILESRIKATQADIEVGALPIVYCNRLHLTQLLMNLINNSIKFRSDRPCQIKVKAKTNNDSYIFSVEDNGIGIEEDYQQQIFKIFNQLEKHNHTGTGIGLAICDKIIKFYGGEIWVNSEKGKGSTFYFSLPRFPKIKHHIIP